MDDRLSHLLTQLRERFPADADVAEVEAYLSSEGYNRREIGEIVSAWVSEIPPVADPRPTITGTSTIPFRVLGPHERGRFSTEAWGHLLSLSHAGLVTGAELEGVIDRALSQVDGRIAIDDLRTIMESGGPDELGLPPDHVTIH